MRFIVLLFYTVVRPEVVPSFRERQSNVVFMFADFDCLAYIGCCILSQYNDNEEELPVDQHQLVALMAPRPVYIASAIEDRWTDPKGEFLSGLHSTSVYELYGLQGMTAKVMPEIDAPVLDGNVVCHVRSGDHDIKLYDWEQFVKLADKYFK